MRAVRVPTGAEWVDVWSGARFAGGTTATLDAPLDGPPPLLARAGSGIAVDLAQGGWHPGPYRRGLWLFPPREGAFACSFVEDAGDGEGPCDRWTVSGDADASRIVATVRREGPGSWGDDAITLLLPPGEARALVIEGGVPAEHEGRRGMTVRV